MQAVIVWHNGTWKIVMQEFLLYNFNILNPQHMWQYWAYVHNNYILSRIFTNIAFFVNYTSSVNC